MGWYTWSDKLNAALHAEVMHFPHLFVAQNRAGRVVRRIHQQQSGMAVHQVAKLIEIHPEPISG